MNVVVAPTANQLIAMLAANPSMRAWNLVTTVSAFLIATRPDSHNDTEAMAQLRTAQGKSGVIESPAGSRSAVGLFPSERILCEEKSQNAEAFSCLKCL
jgi:hypothetical protein